MKCVATQFEVTEMLEPSFQRITLLHRSCGPFAWKWGLESVLTMVGQLNPRVRVLGFLITMSRKEARWWWWWTWTRTYSPQQQALLFLSVGFPNFAMTYTAAVGDFCVVVSVCMAYK